MTYFYDADSGHVYQQDGYGKEVLSILNGERQKIPVRDIPKRAIRLDCSDEDIWGWVEKGPETGN